MQIDHSPFSANFLATHGIDTFHLPAHQSREIWQHIVDGTFHLEPGAGEERGHRVRSKVWFLDELMLSTFAAEANVVYRSKELIERNPTPVLKVRMYRSGHALLLQDNDQTAIGTGAVHFIDHDRPTRQVSSNHEQITLSIPYHFVGYDPSRHPALLSIGLDRPQGRLLQSGLHSIFSELGQLQKSEARSLLMPIVGLLRGTFEGSLDSQDDETVRIGRIAAIKRHIDQHLEDTDLGIDALLRDFGASRATIYRDFAEEGGVQHYIQDRRLQRAYRLLAESPPVRGSVQNVASRFGFLSLAHFSRAFRARFNVTPSALVGRWHHPPVEGAPTAVVQASGPRSPVNAATLDALQWAYKRFK